MDNLHSSSGTFHFSVTMSHPGHDRGHRYLKHIFSHFVQVEKKKVFQNNVVMISHFFHKKGMKHFNPCIRDVCPALPPKLPQWIGCWGRAEKAALGRWGTWMCLGSHTGSHVAALVKILRLSALALSLYCPSTASNISSSGLPTLYY